MTTRPYQGDALCWNTAHKQTYDSACNLVSNDNVGYASDYQYQCYGINPEVFYNNLVNAGEGEDQCVCKFYSATGAAPWTFEGHWGNCNDACVSPYFTCDGQLPIPTDTPQLMHVRALSFANSSATVASTDTTSSSTSAPSQASNSAATSIAASGLDSLYAFLLIAALLWGHIFA